MLKAEPRPSLRPTSRPVLPVALALLLLAACGQPPPPTLSLYRAVQVGNLDRIKRHIAFDWLIRRGADLNRPDAQGRTPLHLAVAGGQLATVNRLLLRGAQINRGDGASRTPLDLALGSTGGTGRPGRDRADIVKLLETNGARRGPAPNPVEQRQ